MAEPTTTCKSRTFCAGAITNFPIRSQCTQQFSISALTNSGGTIVERYAYSAYGEPTITDGSGTPRSVTAEGNRYTYTGREWDDEAEIYHYRARPYDALSGRFLSRDPIGYLGSKWGLYEYVKSQPVGHLDPSGLIEISIGGIKSPINLPWSHGTRDRTGKSNIVYRIHCDCSEAGEVKCTIDIRAYITLDMDRARKRAIEFLRGRGLPLTPENIWFVEKQILEQAYGHEQVHIQRALEFASRQKTWAATVPPRVECGPDCREWARRAEKTLTEKYEEWAGPERKDGWPDSPKGGQPPMNPLPEPTPVGPPAPPKLK